MNSILSHSSLIPIHRVLANMQAMTAPDAPPHLRYSALMILHSRGASRWVSRLSQVPLSFSGLVSPTSALSPALAAEAISAPAAGDPSVEGPSGDSADGAARPTVVGVETTARLSAEVGADAARRKAEQEEAARKKAEEEDAPKNA